MTKRILFLLIPIFFLSAIWPDTTAPALVAYYSFDKCDARDDSGNGSDGQLYGNIGCWCGIENNGLLFDGNDDYVEFSGLVNRYFTTSDFTVSFYFKTEQNSIFPQSMLSKRAACNPDYAFDIQLNHRQRKINTEFSQQEDVNYGDLSPDMPQLGWYHFALVRNGRSAYVYLDGQLLRKGTRCSGVDITNAVLLNFGNSPCIGAGGSRRFKGVLDELRVYDQALNAEEIRALYDQFPIESADADCFS